MMLALLTLWRLRLLLRENRDDQLQSVKKLRSKYSHISNGLIRTREIVADLFQTTVLTARERDDIQIFLSTPVRANEQLLNTLILKDSRGFECFLTALSNTDQRHIAEILIHEDEYLDTKHSLVIRRKYATLIDNTVVSLVRVRRASHGSILDVEPTTQERKSFKALQTTFIKLPDELQTELSLKVAALRQKTTLPSDANMDIFYHKIVRGFIQQRKSLNRQLIEFEDLRKILGRVNEPTENFASQLEGQLKANISVLNEELGWHRNNKRHLDETLQTTATELDESRRRVDALARQLEQWQKENNDLRTERDGTVSELEKILEQEREVWAEEKDRIRNQIQELQNGLSGSSKKCSNLEQELKLQRTENDRLKEQAQEYNSISDADGTVSELEKMLEQERKVWAEEKERVRNKIQELQNELSGSSKKCFNLEQELELQRTENDRLKEETQEYNSISDAESPNIRRQNKVQTEAKDETCERLMQEILHRESECKAIKNYTEQEKSRTNKELRELQETVYELEKRLNLTKSKNKCLFKKFKNSEAAADTLKVLIQRKEKEANEKVNIIEKFIDQAKKFEVNLKEMEAQLRNTEEKLKENEPALAETKEKLRETQEMLKQTEAKLKEFEAKSTATEKKIDNLRSEGSSKKCFNLEQELKLQRTENDRLKEETHEYNRIIDADQRTMLPLLPLWGLRFYLRENGEIQLHFAKKLRSKYSHISNGLVRTAAIVAELYETKVLTAREKDDIQQLLLTPVRANEQLLNTLILKDSRAYECFLTALSNTDQQHIAEMLIHEDGYMNYKHSFMIQKNYTTLIDNLDVDGGHLLDLLYEARLLTRREVETINAKPTKHEKSETLLDLVSKFSVTNFDRFKEALEKSSQEHVVSILTGKDYSNTESTASGSTSVQSTLQGKHFEKETNSSTIPECQDDSNLILLHPQDKNIRTTSKWIKPPSFDVEIKSFKALHTTYMKLPDELQTELSLKVAALRQKTALPSDANVDIFHHMLVQDCRTKILDIEQKQEQERNTWIVEREQLISRIQEQNKLIVELRYKVDPVLVQTIITKAAEEKQKSIIGFTILDKKLFVVSGRSSEVEVYDSMKLSFIHRLNLKELLHPMDLCSCRRNNCLYIFDYKSLIQSKEILRVDPNGKLIKKWSTGEDFAYGLSVTIESNIIFTVCMRNKLNEYSPDGQLIREIYLSSADIRDPLHAIKLTSGHFVICHSCFDDKLHRVCVVDGDGKLKKSFGGKRGSNFGQMGLPSYLAVDGNGFVLVADRSNCRVLLLDSDLAFEREILSREKHGLGEPERILLDQKNGRLFVSDKKWDTGEKMFKGGGLLIFKV